MKVGDLPAERGIGAAIGKGAEALYTFDERFVRKGREAVPPVVGVPEG